MIAVNHLQPGGRSDVLPRFRRVTSAARAHSLAEVRQHALCARCSRWLTVSYGSSEVSGCQAPVALPDLAPRATGTTATLRRRRKLTDAHHPGLLHSPASWSSYQYGKCSCTARTFDYPQAKAPDCPRLLRRYPFVAPSMKGHWRFPPWCSGLQIHLRSFYPIDVLSCTPRDRHWPRKPLSHTTARPLTSMSVVASSLLYPSFFLGFSIFFR
jgi:hypothetical protein